MKIKLPEVTSEELSIIVESLKVNYDKKLRKAQRVAGHRPPKMETELGACQSILQMMMGTITYEKLSTTASGTAGEETNAGPGLAAPDREGN